METVFFRLVNLSLMAGLIVLVVLALRLLFRRAPKWVFCLLWALVALRLLVPIQIESPASLMPSAQPLPFAVQQVEAAFPSSPAIGEMAISPTESPAPEDSSPVSVLPSPPASAPLPDVKSPLSVGAILSWVWLAGMVAMLGWGLGSYLLLRRRLTAAVREDGNVWLCDHIESPFVLGLFRPRIYLPFGLKEEDRSYVLSHEQAHIRRRDHWWKPLGFVLLAVYWFNPLLWAAYILLCRDIESACDERVIRHMDKGSRQAYSLALLNCAVRPRPIAACPLAFGEEGVKGRIRRVMRYRKPAFWIVLLALIALVVTAVCLLTVPKEEEEPMLYTVLTPEGQDEWASRFTVSGIEGEFTVLDATLTSATYPASSKKYILIHEGTNLLFAEKFTGFFCADVDKDGTQELIVGIEDSDRSSVAILSLRAGGQFTFPDAVLTEQDGQLLVEYGVPDAILCRIGSTGDSFGLIGLGDGTIYPGESPGPSNQDSPADVETSPSAHGENSPIEDTGYPLSYTHLEPTAWDGHFTVPGIAGRFYVQKTGYFQQGKDYVNFIPQKALVYNRTLLQVHEFSDIYCADMNRDGVNDLLVSYIRENGSRGLTVLIALMEEDTAQAAARIPSGFVQYDFPTDSAYALVEQDGQLVVEYNRLISSTWPTPCRIHYAQDAIWLVNEEDGSVLAIAPQSPLQQNMVIDEMTEDEMREFDLTTLTAYFPYSAKATPLIGEASRLPIRFTLAEYPDAVFQIDSALTLEQNGEAYTLAGGMPIRQIVVADLNGDGKRELCVDVLFGSGIVDEHIFVFDFVAHTYALFMDRGSYDYRLRTDEDRSVWMDKLVYPDQESEPVASGRLTISQGKLCIDTAPDDVSTDFLPLPDPMMIYVGPAGGDSQPVTEEGGEFRFTNATTLQEFPGRSFQVLGQGVLAIGRNFSGSYTRELLFQSQEATVDGVFFADLTGDGKREICISLTESGENRYVAIIDYANGRQALVRDDRFPISLSSFYGTELWFSLHSSENTFVISVNPAEIYDETDGHGTLRLQLPDEGQEEASEQQQPLVFPFAEVDFPSSPLSIDVPQATGQ